MDILAGGRAVSKETGISRPPAAAVGIPGDPFGVGVEHGFTVLIQQSIVGPAVIGAAGTPETASHLASTVFTALA